MKFMKMHRIGNGYVYVNRFEEMVSCPEKVSRRTGDRYFGINSNGLILIKPSEVVDYRIQIFNVDGFEGAMCGGAIHCVGKYVCGHGTVKETSIPVETKSGLRPLELDTKGSEVVSATVDMEELELTSKFPESITVDGVDYEFVGISTGNPYAVYFMEKTDGPDLEKIRLVFEHHARFPKRTSTEFIRLVDKSHIHMHVQERGSRGIWAYGTGVSASVTASILMGYTDREMEVFLRDGKLVIRWDERSSHIPMTGSAVEVSHGGTKV